MGDNHTHGLGGDGDVAVIWRARDIAELYGVDESTVRRWERAGTLRPARLDPGGNKYWLRDEILEAARAEPAAAADRATPHVEAWVSSTRRPRRRREATR